MFPFGEGGGGGGGGGHCCVAHAIPRVHSDSGFRLDSMGIYPWKYMKISFIQMSDKTIRLETRGCKWWGLWVDRDYVEHIYEIVLSGGFYCTVLNWCRQQGCLKRWSMVAAIYRVTHSLWTVWILLSASHNSRVHAKSPGVCMRVTWQATFPGRNTKRMNMERIPMFVTRTYHVTTARWHIVGFAPSVYHYKLQPPRFDALKMAEIGMHLTVTTVDN